MQKAKIPQKEAKKSEDKKKSNDGSQLKEPRKVTRVLGHRTLSGLRK